MHRFCKEKLWWKLLLYEYYRWRTRVSIGRSKGPLCSICWEQQKQVRCSYFNLDSPGVSVTPWTSCRRVWLRLQLGDHHSLSGGCFFVSCWRKLAYVMYICLHMLSILWSFAEKKTIWWVETLVKSPSVDYCLRIHVVFM